MWEAIQEQGIEECHVGDRVCKSGQTLKADHSNFGKEQNRATRSVPFWSTRSYNTHCIQSQKTGEKMRSQTRRRRKNKLPAASGSLTTSCWSRQHFRNSHCRYTETMNIMMNLTKRNRYYENEHRDARSRRQCDVLGTNHHLPQTWTDRIAAPCQMRMGNFHAPSTSKHYPLRDRLRPSMRYAAGTWVMTEAMKKRLNATQRRMITMIKNCERRYNTQTEGQTRSRRRRRRRRTRRRKKKEEEEGRRRHHQQPTIDGGNIRR